MNSNLPESPFRGIESFRYADRHLFAEREQEKAQLYSLINIYKGSLLYGQSGMGKSSLIAAGLIPLLEEYYQPELIRVYPGRSGTFIITRILRSEETMEYMPSVFDQENQTSAKISLSFIEFRECILRITSNGLSTEIKRKTPVLIFDQFEELITLFEETGTLELTAELDKPGRLELQHQIIGLLRELYYSGSRLKMLFVFREDYIAKFSGFFDALPDLSNCYLRIINIALENIPCIIEYPFKKDPEQTTYKDPFSPRVLSLLNEKISYYFTENEIVLTDIQIVCLFLYERPDAERILLLSQNDAIRTIIENFYKNILNEFSSSEKTIAIAILSILVLNERTRNTFHYDLIAKEYFEQSGSQAVPEYESVKVHFDSVLSALEGRTKIIRKEHRKDGDYYEIRSEAVIPYILKEKNKREAYLLRKNQARIMRNFAFLGLAVVVVLITAILYQRSKNSEIRALAMFFKAGELQVSNNMFESIRIYERLRHEKLEFISSRLHGLKPGEFDIGGLATPLGNNFIFEYGNDSTCRIWKVLSPDTMKLVYQCLQVSTTAFSHNNTLVAFFSGRELNLFNSATGERSVISRATNPGTDLTFSVNSDYLSYYTNHLCLIDPVTKVALNYKVKKRFLFLFQYCFISHKTMYSLDVGYLMKARIKGDSLVWDYHPNWPVNPLSLYAGGDSVLYGAAGKLLSLNLVNGITDTLARADFQYLIQETKDLIFFYQQARLNNEEGYKKIYFYNLRAHRFYEPFRNKQFTYLKKLSVSADWSKNIATDNLGNRWLFYADQTEPVRLDTLKDALAYDISDDARYVLFVKKMHAPVPPAVRKSITGLSYGSRDTVNDLLLIYDLLSRRSRLIDTISQLSLARNTDTSGIYKNYFFVTNASSDKVAYKRNSHDSMSFFIKDLQADTLVYKTTKFVSYFYAKSGNNFRHDYIFLNDENFRKGIILLNSKPRNLTYFSRNGIPQITDREWKSQSDKLNLGL